MTDSFCHSALTIPRILFGTRVVRIICIRFAIELGYLGRDALSPSPGPSTVCIDASGIVASTVTQAAVHEGARWLV